MVLVVGATDLGTSPKCQRQAARQTRNQLSPLAELVKEVPMEPMYGLLRMVFGGRNPRFLLPETQESYSRLLLDAVRIREERISAILARGESLFAIAQDLFRLAEQQRSGDWKNDAQRELANRRAAAAGKDGADVAEKARAFEAAARKLRRRPWSIAEKVNSKAENPPRRYRSYWAWAAEEARRCEMVKIVQEGACILSTPVKEDTKTIWCYERRVIYYRERLFLAMLTQRKGERAADWQIDWVSDSVTQMTQEELRTAASAV